MKIRNPRNGEFDYDLKVNSVAEIQGMADSLRRHQADWAALGIAKRVEIIKQFANALQLGRKEIFEALSVDTGRRRICEIEIDGTVGMIYGRCASAPSLMGRDEERPSYSNPDVNIRQQHVAYPIVGVISPWNFPLLLGLIDAIPALLAGSAVMLKASEVTPRFLDPLEENIANIPVLKHVVKIVRGGIEAGKAVIDHVDAICFTGSTSTGLKIAQHAARRFIPAFLEMGGKDPAIVLADANLEVASDAIIRSAIGASGQACQSLERIYIHASIFESFVELLVSKCSEIQLNDDYNVGGTLGPMILDKQAMKIKDQIADAVEKGAEIKCGGQLRMIHGGLWVEPTVLTAVNHTMSIMTEETFGPVIPCMSFEHIEDAIILANDSQYGLSASVFSTNIRAAHQVACEINAGGISINDGSLTNQVFDASKNSFNLSGINGSRMGSEGFTRFFRKKAIMIQTVHPKDIHSQDE